MENVSAYTSLARPGEGVVYTPDPVAKDMVVTLLSIWFESQFPDKHSAIHTFLTYGKPPAFAGQALQRLTSATLCDPAVGEGVFIQALASRLRDIFPAEYQPALNTWMSTKITGWDMDADVIARIRDRLAPSIHLEHGDFLLSGASTKYDLIIANPPYVRQEKLEPDYKHKLRSIFARIDPDLKISLRADYYLYFLVAMCLRLKPDGVLTAIVPNGWLDNAFGQIFRELLLSRFCLRKIETLNRRRHFQSEVNTVILSVQRRRPDPKNSVRVIIDDRTKAFPQVYLKRLKLGWNGSLFRAPDWLLETIATNEKIVPLGTVADIRAGIITGNNRRYYSRESRLPTDTPVIKSPREINSYTVRENNCVWWLPTENIPFTIRRAPILWPDLRGRRHFVVHNPENLAYEHTFYGVTPRTGSTEALTLILNSIWVNLLLEIYGRTGLGGGAIRMVKRDLIHLPVPDPRQSSWEAEHYRLLDLPIGVAPVSLHRKIDKIILCELGLENRWDEMQYHLNIFIEQRQARAKNQTHG